MVEFRNAGAKLVTSGNAVKNRTCVIILRLHPRRNLRALQILKPTVRVLDIRAKVSVDNIALGSIRWCRRGGVGVTIDGCGYARQDKNQGQWNRKVAHGFSIDR